MLGQVPLYTIMALAAVSLLIGAVGVVVGAVLGVGLVLLLVPQTRQEVVQALKRKKADVAIGEAE